MKRYWISSMFSGLAMGYMHLAPADHPWFQAPPFPSLIGILLCWALIYRGISAQRTALGSAFHAAWAGFFYFAVSIYWVGVALVSGTDGWSAIALAAAGSIGCTVILFQWWSFAAFVANLLSRSWTVAGPVSFATCWSIADFLCSDAVYGIPIGSLGAAVVDTPFSSFLEVAGTNGVSFLIVWIGCAFGVSRPSAVIMPLSAVAVAGLLSFAWTLPPKVQLGGDARVAAIQLGDMSHVSLDNDELLSHLLGYTRSGLAAGADIIIFPETTLLGSPQDFKLVSTLQASLGEGKMIILGGRSIEPRSETALTFDLYNSVFAITEDGAFRLYDKTHLAIFGEYMPLIFRIMGFDVIGGRGGLAQGDGLHEFAFGATRPFILTICYEGLMSGPIQRAMKNAGWMVNVSNEYLFGETAGAYIIQRYNRMRSIETGLPTVRATMTGFTGVIDTDGREIGTIAPGRSGVVIADVPASMPTFFARFGYIPLHALQFFNLMVILVQRYGKRWRENGTIKSYVT